MELQKTKHEIKLVQWRELVLSCRASGIPIKDWCKERNICLQTYYRWQKQVWDGGIQQLNAENAPSENAVFVEYIPPTAAALLATPAIILHLNCGSLEIHNGAVQAVIENTLAALKKLC